MTDLIPVVVLAIAYLVIDHIVFVVFKRKALDNNWKRFCSHYYSNFNEKEREIVDDARLGDEIDKQIENLAKLNKERVKKGQEPEHIVF